jgi:small subunit ribosomal protein S17
MAGENEKQKKTAEGTPGEAAPPSHKAEKVGQVVSAKMQKTIVVEVTRRVPHPLYKRIVTKRKKFYAHDEQGQAKVGDIVRIIECRPLSRLKRWRLEDIVRRAIDPLAGLKAPDIENLTPL